MMANLIAEWYAIISNVCLLVWYKFVDFAGKCVWNGGATSVLANVLMPMMDCRRMLCGSLVSPLPWFLSLRMVLKPQTR